ncbi:MAG: DMT family transporter [Flavobacteriaceae bacterium]|nr:DMT family transporter [Flavobacteriaceae bacterium]MCY4216631.1 DMT family transporter [Flavobacteriaceae bacterium]MCY4253697.1 DMT family transporter [Flavobacteriaceae bacterium]
MQTKRLQHFGLVTTASLLIATSGPLGRYIDLAPQIIIWCRSFIAIFVLGGYCIYKKYPLLKDLKNHKTGLLFSGILMGIHWVTYFIALKLSNVAIAALAVFTFPIMTVFLEPLIRKVSFQRIHLLFGFMIVLGVYFLVPEFNFKDQKTLGLIMGLISAFAYAIRNIMVKTKISDMEGSSVMFFQMIVVTVLLFPTMFYYPIENISSQWPFLLFLGIVTTSLGHTLFANSFKSFSTSNVSILNSIQPVFAILLALIFLNEIPQIQSIIGGSLILLTVVLEGLRKQ